jgi:hypothetical protein
MIPTKCSACGSDQLFGKCNPDWLFLKVGFFKVVPITAEACLSCGMVTTYLDEVALDKVRKWSGMEIKPKATIGEL